MEEIKNLKNKVKRNLKDSVFTSIFSKPRYARELYIALTGENVKEEEIEIVTIENVICNGIYNDLGFLVRGKDLFLVEAQSTKCPNIVFRIDDYYLRTIKRHINNYNFRQYGSKVIKEMYNPYFISIYTGTGDVPEYYETEICYFSGQSLKIRVKNFTLSNSVGIIRAYIVWCLKYDELCLEYGRTAQAVAKAIEFCLESEETEELRDYMLEYRTEVEMILEENNAQEAVIDSLVDECIQEGRVEGIKSTLERLKVFLNKTGFEDNFQTTMYDEFVAFIS